MNVDDLWAAQRDDVFDVVADIDPPSARIEYAFKAGYQASDKALRRLFMGAASDAHVLRRHPPYGSSFLDCEKGPCPEYRAALE